MVTRFTKSQRDKLREHFRLYVYYRLCRAVRTVFMKRCSVISLFEEDLFVVDINIWFGSTNVYPAIIDRKKIYLLMQ